MLDPPWIQPGDFGLRAHFRDRGSRGDRFRLRLKSGGAVVGSSRRPREVTSWSLAVAGTEVYARRSPSGDEELGSRCDGTTGWGLVPDGPPPTAGACSLSMFLLGGAIPRALVGTSTDPS